MNREEIINYVRGLKSNNILLEFATGTGKTISSIERIRHIKDNAEILVVVPRLFIIDSWKIELKKFHYEYLLSQITFITYNSLEKAVGKHFDFVVYDEAHHLTTRCCNIVPKIKADNNILLSATIDKYIKKRINAIFPKLECTEITLDNAIENNILPNPLVILIPLRLDGIKKNMVYKFHPKCKYAKRLTYVDYKNNTDFVRKNKGIGYNIYCTPAQYYKIICNEIDDLKEKLDNFDMYPGKLLKIFRNRVKQLGNRRLAFLSEMKTPVCKRIVEIIKNKRNITFCYRIEQAEILGNSITSKNKKQSKKNLDDFNNNKISSITAVGCLNEGVNLTSCEVGLFAGINVKELPNIQKIGRILRHEKPILIFPYFEDTKDETIISGLTENYTDVKVIKNSKELYENIY